MSTEITINNLVLKNPLTVASGTAGYGEELSQFYDLSQLGALFTKGLSLRPRDGNKGNRILETPSGILNSIGLENVGLEAFLEKKLPFLRVNDTTVIANIAGHSIEENIELCRILSQTEGIHALELNVSCPNVKEGGMAFGTNLKTFTDLLEGVRKVTICPLIVKLSPNVTDITEFALRAERTGVDAISAVNTFLGMKIDTDTGRPYFNNKVAGLSGPAIRPLAVRAVYQIYETISIPIIGIGGICTFNDMLEFMFAGASAVSLGTVNMIHPERPMGLLKELQNYMKDKTIDNIKNIIGKAHT